jgi:hypothetical protein
VREAAPAQWRSLWEAAHALAAYFPVWLLYLRARDSHQPRLIALARPFLTASSFRDGAVKMIMPAKKEAIAGRSLPFRPILDGPSK